MNNIKRYTFIFIFFVSLFLFINSVNADYKASAINPIGAKCSLHSKSTGYCYYANKNLNSYPPGVAWLDTGDEVTVLTSYEKLESPNKDLCSDYYVYTSFNYNGKLYHGYYCNKYLKSLEDIGKELKDEFKEQGFPESYWSKLAIMKEAHPNWNFKAIDTGIKFSDAVTNQTYGDNSLVRGSNSNNYAYLSLNENSFDYINDSFIPYDDITGSNPWYLANYDTIAYYMDPRNFLSDMYIFQFETLSYDNSIADEQITDSISSIFGSGYLSNFINIFLDAGKISGVNPIYLSSLSKQEVGNGSTPGTAISGTYNGMYNFYNIGANSGANPVLNGLNFAANTDEYTLRPWTTERAAIVGGAKWIFRNYVEPGQDTSYFKKYNVVYNYLKSIGRKPKYSNYSHQYMQNIAAPSIEATTTYKSYYDNNMLGLSYTFYIPIYNNMPEETSLPNQGGWPNNYLSSISINENSIPEFDGGIETYNYYLDINTPKLKIEAKPVSNKAKVEGNGEFEIKEDTTKVITVKAENGNVKTYKIVIKLTGTKLEDPIDVVTTLNNAGIKNGDKYISGVNINTDISTIKAKILNANPLATVNLTDSSNKEKNSGIVKTGDKVTIKVSEEVKTYEIVIYGDVNGDGKISAIDYVRIKNNILGTINLSGVNHEAADVDRNGKISAIDYVRVKNSILGIFNILQ